MIATVPLRRLVNVIDCAHVTAAFVDDDRRFPVASIRECQGPYVDLSHCNYTTKEFFDYLRAADRAPHEGDLLFVRNVSVGLVSAVSPGTPEFAVGQETVLLRRTSDVDPTFLRYALAGAEAKHAIESAMIGTTFRRINVSAIRALPVTLPSREEQRAIADYLHRETARIDSLIEEQQRLIEMLRERRSAAVEEAVAAVQTTGQRLKHTIRSVRQGWSPQCYPWPADGVESWAVLKTGAANGGVFRPMENKELPETEVPRPEIAVRRGDLIVSRANTRDLVGSAAVVDGDFPRLMLCDKLYAFTLDETQALPRFVAAVLGSRRWRDMIELEATGASSSMLNVSQSDIVNLPMPLPTLDDQHQILSRLHEQTAKIDVLLIETERFIELARERRSALITAAVAGQIDVREMA